MDSLNWNEISILNNANSTLHSNAEFHTVSNPISTLNADANSTLMQKKTTSGRRKIPIAKIDNKNRKHVTFSKRRKGLFKKASELCVLCGASVAIITFSEAGKVFTFSHPSINGVINRYLDGSSSTSVVVCDQRMWWERPIQELEFEELGPFAAALMDFRSNLERRIMDIYFECQSKTALMATTIKSQFNNELLVQQRMTPTDNHYNIAGN